MERTLTSEPTFLARMVHCPFHKRDVSLGPVVPLDDGLDRESMGNMLGCGCVASFRLIQEMTVTRKDDTNG